MNDAEVNKKLEKAIEEKILDSIGANWVIVPEDVGRELFVVSADRKQVLLTIKTLIKAAFPTIGMEKLDKKVLWECIPEIHKYVEDYELRGDEGDYTPNEQEKTLMEDMARGLVEEIHEAICESFCVPAVRLPEEFVICSAVKLSDGYIARGHRHGDCIRHINEKYAFDKKKVDWDGNVQGFITSRNRFVNREEGRKIQDFAGIKSVEGYRGDTLFSEDLY